MVCPTSRQILAPAKGYLRCDRLEKTSFVICSRCAYTTTVVFSWKTVILDIEMSSNPLSYDGLKTVLQYLDATLRYQLSSRIPSISVIEKLVPLRFDRILFKHLQTKVNKTTYRLGVYRKYPDGYDIPKTHRKNNERGGTQVDHTEHGFQIYYAHRLASPGDIDISLPEQLLHQEIQQDYLNDGFQILFEQHLHVFERALTIRLENGDDAVLGVGNGDTRIGVNDLQNADIDLEVRARLEEEAMNRVLPLSAEKIREGIEGLHLRLAPYYCRRDNTPPPYTLMIQLTVESPVGTDIYRHQHTKLQDAMKKMNVALFGDRNCVHHLRSLSVDERRMVLRLPAGFRIRTRELSVAGGLLQNYKALQSIVEESSYPLNVLSISHNIHEVHTYNNEVVKNAKELNISPMYDPHVSCLPILLILKNPSVNVRCPFGMFSVQEQVQLMENWIDNGKEVGTTLSYQAWRTRSVDYLLNQITFRFMGNQFERRVMMPMNNGNRLEVQCNLLENRRDEERRKKWEVKMKVIAGQEEDDNL